MCVRGVYVRGVCVCGVYVRGVCVCGAYYVVHNACSACVLYLGTSGYVNYDYTLNTMCSVYTTLHDTQRVYTTLSFSSYLFLLPHGNSIISPSPCVC